MDQYPVVIFGAGPAGLTAGYELVKNDIHPIVFEKSDMVGGISRTEHYKGYHFDIGGHRFYTKIKEVEAIWHELLKDEFFARPRVSRIFFEGKFYDYPLKISNTLSNLGLYRSFLVGLSYLQSLIFPYPNEDNFEEWISNRFGKALFRIFFKTYTEKVWGIPCTEIRAEWAAQRIKGLSLPVSIRNALFFSPSDKVKTLINSFHYPRYGPGMMWEAAQNFIDQEGGKVSLNSEVSQVVHEGNRVTHVIVEKSDGGENKEETKINSENFISSMPISELIKRLSPAAPQEVLSAAEGLSYRDFLTVILLVNSDNIFHDNWLYIHSPEVKVGRIQNYKNWSPDMVPDAAKTSLGLEYFCTVGDEIWEMPDDELLELGGKEVEHIGIARREDIFDGTVVRQPKAYPIYNRTYDAYLKTIREYLEEFENLQTIGRNGLHKYNNQDHSMLTALLAAWNVQGEDHNIWDVNTERSYYEEVRISQEILSSDKTGFPG
ncbi:MAG: NAD(P)/FAD-dependent oxidoreductase [Chloroflexi bacterium]|nr:NAD(P)/FAD-dependent oxidoreductase [Chloroflexota bacterium]